MFTEASNAVFKEASNACASKACDKRVALRRQATHVTKQALTSQPSLTVKPVARGGCRDPVVEVTDDVVRGGSREPAEPAVSLLSLSSLSSEEAVESL